LNKLFIFIFIIKDINISIIFIFFTHIVFFYSYVKTIKKKRQTSLKTNLTLSLPAEYICPTHLEIGNGRVKPIFYYTITHIFLIRALKISIGISNATIDMFLADMTLE